MSLKNYFVIKNLKLEILLNAFIVKPVMVSPNNLNKGFFSDLSRQQKIGVVVLLLFSFLIIVFWFIQLRQNILYSPYGDIAIKQLNQSPVVNNSANLTLDTDKDGLTDIEEMTVYKTSPYLSDSDGDGLDDRTEVNNKTNPNCPEGQDCIQTGIYNSSSATTEPQTITSATIPTNITSSSLPSTQAAVLQQAFGATPDVAVLRQTLLLGATDEDKTMLNSLSDAQLLQLYNQMINGQSAPAAQ